MCEQSNRLIITTLHQPSSEIVDLLDEVYVMAQGEFVYGGDAHSGLVKYISQELQFSIPLHTNLLELFLYHVQMQHFTVEEYHSKWVGYQTSHAQASPLALTHDTVDDETDVLVVSAKPCFVIIIIIYFAIIYYVLFFVSLWLQFTQLLGREVKCFVREPTQWRLRTLLAIVLSLMFSLLWHNLTNNCSDIRNRYGLLFLVISLNVSAAVGISNLTFPQMKVVIEKERKSCEMYYSYMFAFTKSLVVIPPAIIQVIIMTCILYFLIPFNSNIWYVMMVLCLSHLAGDSMGFIIGVVSDTPSVAFQVSHCIDTLYNKQLT
ncbi:hypothetical protein RFI_11701 [Reticulomyxa filosa]|uniref:ABC-2 type transporter transmembrane domain-containing protein n=1 Tax=Reticulomyxa filosa TaxID=46433 RepID=X6NHI9_RETFI|nr:hypothetical protein RFI_11701 [Reticulomyxa filosa]|eukprot:ETO25436.1 hypothetical protein RFI_11701 [Reticulomyxa filosa]